MAGISTIQWHYDQFGIVATLQLADNVRKISMEEEEDVFEKRKIFRCRTMSLLGKDFYQPGQSLVYQ